MEHELECLRAEEANNSEMQLQSELIDDKIDCIPSMLMALVENFTKSGSKYCTETENLFKSSLDETVALETISSNFTAIDERRVALANEKRLNLEKYQSENMELDRQLDDERQSYDFIQACIESFEKQNEEYRELGHNLPEGLSPYISRSFYHQEKSAGNKKYHFVDTMFPYNYGDQS